MCGNTIVQFLRKRKYGRGFSGLLGFKKRMDAISKQEAMNKYKLEVFHFWLKVWPT